MTGHFICKYFDGTTFTSKSLRPYFIFDQIARTGTTKTVVSLLGLGHFYFWF